MRKKNTIRLNESQLHNMISESVKQVLSELDWKTAVNAANKSRKNLQRYALNHAFNDVDPYNDYYRVADMRPQDFYVKRTKPHNYSNVKFVPEREEFIRRMKQADNLAKHANRHIRDYFGSESYYNNLGHIGEEFPEYRLDTGFEDEDGMPLSYYPDGTYGIGIMNIPDDEVYKYNFPDSLKTIKKKEQERNDFLRGKYKYVKGKGWQLKK